MKKPKQSKIFSEQKHVEIKWLSQEFFLYSNPIILMMNFKGGKRAEAAQWSLEIQKMLKGVVKSVIGLESMMNFTEQDKKIYIDNLEVNISNKEVDWYWLMIYLIDNAILRIYACLDKIAQMVRCYFEHKENGGNLEVIAKCGCKEPMDEKNCTFGSLLNCLAKDNKRNTKIVNALKKLNSNKSVQVLRTYRNTFTHRKHGLDQTRGLDPRVKPDYKDDGTVETKFVFVGGLPSVNWFRVEIVNANNAIVECVEEIGEIIFPRNFQIVVKDGKIKFGQI